MKLKIWLAALLILASSITATPSYAESPLTLAYQGPLTGPEATIGQMELRAVQFAIKLFAEQNPPAPTIILNQIDDQGDPSVASPLSAKTAASKELLGIIGPAYSGAARVSIPAWSASSLTAISPSATNPALSTLLPAGTSTFFRVAPVDLFDAPAFFNSSILGVINPRIFIVTGKDPYSESYAKAIQALAVSKGVAVTTTLGLADNEISSSSLATQVLNAQANVVLTTSYSTHTIAIATVLRKSGYTGVISANSASFDPVMISRSPVAVTEGLRIVASNVNLEDISADLAKKYLQSTGNEPDIFTVPTIDATNVFLKCFIQGARTRQDVYLCVKNFKGTSLDGSPFAFQTNGNYEKSIFPTYEVKSGKVQLLQDLYRIGYSQGVGVLPVKSISITKGKFSVSTSDLSSRITIPAGSENLGFGLTLTNTNSTVEATLQNSNGTVSRLSYPITITNLSGGNYSINLAIRDSSTKLTQNMVIQIKQMTTLSAPKLGTSLLQNGEVRIDFQKTAIAEGYDLEVEVNGKLERVIADVNPGQTVSGLKPGSSVKLSLVARTSSEFSENLRAVSPPSVFKIKSGTLTCIKGKVVKKVTGSNPKCPSGYKAQ